MALRIQNNIPSLTANRNLTTTTNRLAISLERLSSGYRINRSADDAAGLSISQKFRAQVASLQSASRNATEASSVLQVAEGGMEQIHNMLTRLKELATQSASSNSDGSRNEIDAEAQKLVDEIDRIATSTNYNGVSLLNGYGTRSVGTDPELSISNLYDFKVDSAATGSYTFSAYNTTTNVVSLTFGSTTETATLATNSTISFGNLGVEFKVTAGATLDTLGAALVTLNNSGTADFGVSGTAAQYQLGDSNQADNKLSFSLSSLTKSDLSINTLSLATQSGAQTALGTIDTAIDTVNTARGAVGANMNRLGFAQANLAAAVENLTASESVVRDVDMALEMSVFTKNQILQQAGISMLAQANAMPQAALSLLQ